MLGAKQCCIWRDTQVHGHAAARPVRGQFPNCTGLPLKNHSINYGKGENKSQQMLELEGFSMPSSLESPEAPYHPPPCALWQALPSDQSAFPPLIFQFLLNIVLQAASTTQLKWSAIPTPAHTDQFLDWDSEAQRGALICVKLHSMPDTKSRPPGLETTVCSQG